MTHRFRPSFFLSLLLVTVATSACIVVVEEDDDYRRRYLHGTEWTLEVVFYRTETIQAADRDITVSFDENGLISGRTPCGPFTGTYTLRDNDGFDIADVTHSACSDLTMTRVFDQLDAVTTATVTDASLDLKTADTGRLAFTRK